MQKYNYVRADRKMFKNSTEQEVLLEKLIFAQVFRKFLTFNGTSRSISEFAGARQWYLSWAI
jgi:hypothetical protein